MFDTHYWFVFSILADKDSLIMQARHYKTLQEMFKKTKPNKDAVSQILDLEFEARRAFIDSDAMKEEDRPTKILNAYPCFKDLHHVSNWFVILALQKKWSIVAGLNTHYITGDEWAATDPG